MLDLTYMMPKGLKSVWLLLVFNPGKLKGLTPWSNVMKRDYVRSAPLTRGTLVVGIIAGKL